MERTSKRYIKARPQAGGLVRLNTLFVPRPCCPRFSITNLLWYANLEVNRSSDFAYLAVPLVQAKCTV